jgi:hypothetical protein
MIDRPRPAASPSCPSRRHAPGAAPPASPRQALDLFGRYLDVISGRAPTVDPDGIETQFRRHLDTLVPIRERMERKSV